MIPERRRSERTATATIAYIHLDPDNGGIVLNFSEHGLAFHAAGPVQEEGIVRFWLSLRPNQRIEGTGEMAWTDKAGKIGGLRLTGLSAEASERIHSWLNHPSNGASSSDEVYFPLPIPSNGDIAGEELQLEAKPDVKNLPVKVAPTDVPPSEAREKPPAAARKIAAKPSILSRSAAPARQSKPGSRWPWLLIVSLLILAGVGAGILYRRHVGSVLIYIGNQLHTSQSRNHAPAAPSLLPNSTPKTAAQYFSLPPAAPQDDLEAEIAEFDRENQVETETASRHARIPGRRPKPPPVGESYAPPAAGARNSEPLIGVSAPAKKSATVLPLSPLAEAYTGKSVQQNPANNSAGTDRMITQDRSPQQQLQPVGPVGAEALGGESGDRTPLYLDIGNSKDVTWADQTAEAILQLGFSVAVVRKGHLWMSSYHVLVGPYVTDESLDKASEALEARGYVTRNAKR